MTCLSSFPGTLPFYPGQKFLSLLALDFENKPVSTKVYMNLHYVQHIDDIRIVGSTSKLLDENKCTSFDAHFSQDSSTVGLSVNGTLLFMIWSTSYH